MATWRFRDHPPGEPVRNPIQGEFFSTEAIANAAEALVREGIQNSLDARLGAMPVHVRIYISGPSGALRSLDAARFATDLWPHLSAPKNGLATAPGPGEDCAFLCFEDFGTKGLNGDPAQAYLDDDTLNAFYTFFRAEGLSQKDKKDLGRWGIGKTVFPRASRAGVFFGLSVRSDDGQRMLMGRGTLKYHRTADGRHFASDGYFGEHRLNVTYPVTGAGTLDDLASAFHLSRTNESGLSVVVPWCEPDIQFADIAAAVIRGYFFPILKGELTVTVESPARTIELTTANFEESVKALGGKQVDDVLAWFALAQGALAMKPENRLQVPEYSGSGAQKWTKDLISADLAGTIRQRLAEGEAVGIRVPALVRYKAGGSTKSFFDVYLRRDEKYDEGRALFVREGIIISDVRASRTRKVRAFVNVEDDALANMLGDSENPAHTQWQKDSSNFKGKYVYGPSSIEFVVESAARLVRFVTEDDTEQNLVLAREFFSVSDEAAPPVDDGDGHGPGEEPVPPIIDPPSPGSPRWLRIVRAPGGFSLKPGSTADATGREFTVRVAFDVRRGNPFTKYATEDFTLLKGAIQPVTQEGVDILDATENTLRIRVTAAQFALTMSGFDENRDLVVQSREVRNEAQV
jgi:hypothetical protein